MIVKASLNWERTGPGALNIRVTRRALISSCTKIYWVTRQSLKFCKVEFWRHYKPFLSIVMRSCHASFDKIDAAMGGQVITFSCSGKETSELSPCSYISETIHFHAAQVVYMSGNAILNAITSRNASRNPIGFLLLLVTMGALCCICIKQKNSLSLATGYEKGFRLTQWCLTKFLNATAAACLISIGESRETSCTCQYYSGTMAQWAAPQIMSDTSKFA